MVKGCELGDCIVLHRNIQTNNDAHDTALSESGVITLKMNASSARQGHASCA